WNHTAAGSGRRARLAWAAASISRCPSPDRGLLHRRFALLLELLPLLQQYIDLPLQTGTLLLCRADPIAGCAVKVSRLRKHGIEPRDRCFLLLDPCGNQRETLLARRIIRSAAIARRLPIAVGRVLLPVC